MDFAKRLHTRRRALGLSLREVATRSGLSVEAIEALESGQRAPSDAERRALERVLTVRPSQILEFVRREARSLVAAHGGHEPRVFGSVARGSDTDESDVDLLVTFDEGSSIGDLLALEDALASLLTVPVDVVSTGSSGRIIERAMREAVPL